MSEKISFARLTIPNPGLTPVEVYGRLNPAGGGFILHGVAPDSHSQRAALVSGPRVHVVLVENGDDPFETLRSILSTFAATPQTDAAFAAGMVGYVSYEATEVIEPSVGRLQNHSSGAPIAGFMIPDEFNVIDPSRESLTISVRSSADEQARFQTISDLLMGPAPTTLGPESDLTEPQLTHHVTSQAEYETMVREAKDAIDKGELIHTVVSQCVTRTTSARPINIYQQLTQLNLSPYMFFMDFDEFQLIGSSPELMVRVTDRVAKINPIAGIRPRGSTPETDVEMRRELLPSEKERAEHIMLVDLARNDLCAVCEPGTLSVPSMMQIEKYTHVQHLVSRVRGKLRHELDAIDALKSGFPAGTSAGAPKIRAMELIHELESVGRGPYTGTVGWFSASGDIDTETVIRSMIIHDGVAYVHGGGGMVHDSDPTAEYFESIHKMTTPLEGLSRSEEFRWRNRQSIATDSANSKPALTID